jgi:hypothetical protein
MSRQLTTNAGNKTYTIRGRNKSAEITLTYVNAGEYKIEYTDKDGNAKVETFDKTRDAWARGRALAKGDEVKKIEKPAPAPKEPKTPKAPKAPKVASAKKSKKTATETESDTTKHTFYDASSKQKVEASIEAKKENNGKCYFMATSASGKRLITQVKREVYESSPVQVVAE